eukprot:gene8738-6144_t
MKGFSIAKCSRETSRKKKRKELHTSDGSLLFPALFHEAKLLPASPSAVVNQTFLSASPLFLFFLFSNVAVRHLVIFHTFYSAYTRDKDNSVSPFADINRCLCPPRSCKSHNIMSSSTESDSPEKGLDRFPPEALNWGEAPNSGSVGSQVLSQNLVINDDDDSFESLEPLNILYYSFQKLCKEKKVRKGTGDLKDLFGYWTDEISLENVDTYPSMKVINLRNAYLGAEQLMVLADILRVENMETVRAPTKAAIRIKAMRHAPTSFKVCRLPELLAISLRDMSLDFTVDERVKFLPPGRQSHVNADRLPTAKISANEAIRYFLTAVSGHPSLEVLDLSNNQIGPHLLPALAAFIKATPSLTKIKLHNTLLNNSEIELINAQCQLNKLRIEAQDQNRRLELREIWKIMQIDWLRKLSEKLLREYTEDISKPLDPTFEDVAEEHIPPKVPPLFRSQSSHVRIIEPPREVVDALERFHRKCSSDSDSMLLLDRPATTVGATHRLDALAVGKAERYSHLFNAPYLRYYNGHEVPGMLSERFVNPHTAEMTFLRGRKPCPTLPHCRAMLSSPPKDEELRQRLKKEIGSSLLLSAVERVLFPRPPKPKRLLRGIGEADPNLRTTAEENYMTIIEHQERQWNFILDKLVDHMLPAYFFEGDTIYKEGEMPYWLWFLPAEDQDSPPTAESPKHPKQIEIVLESHFFGERELFGTTPLYIHQHSRLRNETLDLGLLREKYKYREGAAVLMTTTTDSHSYSSTHSKSMTAVYETPRATKKKQRILVWQIPFEVALFYLFEPYQKFHVQAAQAMQSLPATRDLHPSIAAILGYILQPHGLTAGQLSKQGKTAEGGKRHVVARHEEVLNSTFILEEGEFIFGAISPYGKWSEKQLQGGTVVTNSKAFALDTKARLQRSQSGLHEMYQPPQIVGKSAAMRQFRELKKRSKKFAGSHAVTPRTQPTDFTGEQEYVLALGMQASHWKYYVIKNEDWFSLPQDIRLALSNGSYRWVSPAGSEVHRCEVVESMLHIHPCRHFPLIYVVLIVNALFRFYTFFICCLYLFPLHLFSDSQVESALENNNITSAVGDRVNQAFLTHTMFSTKVNFWLTNHHTGQGKKNSGGDPSSEYYPNLRNLRYILCTFFSGLYKLESFVFFVEIQSSHKLLLIVHPPCLHHSIFDLHTQSSTVMAKGSQGLKHQLLLCSGCFAGKVERGEELLGNRKDTKSTAPNALLEQQIFGFYVFFPFFLSFSFIDISFYFIIIYFSLCVSSVIPLESPSPFQYPFGNMERKQDSYPVLCFSPNHKPTTPPLVFSTKLSPHIRENYSLPSGTYMMNDSLGDYGTANKQDSYTGFRFEDTPVNNNTHSPSGRDSPYTVSVQSELQMELEAANPAYLLPSERSTPINVVEGDLDKREPMRIPDWDPGDINVVSELAPQVVHRALQSKCRFIAFPSSLPPVNHSNTGQVDLALFIGQVRFETSPAELIWLIHRTCGACASHLESRGAGCYLLYLKSQADLVLVRSLHKRILFDIGGVWLARSPEEVDALCEYVAVEAPALSKKARLPRDSMVVEELKMEANSFPSSIPYHHFHNKRGMQMQGGNRRAGAPPAYFAEPMAMAPRNPYYYPQGRVAPMQYVPMPPQFHPSSALNGNDLKLQREVSINYFGGRESGPLRSVAFFFILYIYSDFISLIHSIYSNYNYHYYLCSHGVMHGSTWRLGMERQGRTESQRQEDRHCFEKEGLTKEAYLPVLTSCVGVLFSIWPMRRHSRSRDKKRMKREENNNETNLGEKTGASRTFYLSLGSGVGATPLHCVGVWCTLKRLRAGDVYSPFLPLLYPVFFLLFVFLLSSLSRWLCFGVTSLALGGKTAVRRPPCHDEWLMIPIRIPIS